MIKKTGDLFTSDAKAIGHGVNTFGVMGAGIAAQFRDRFPDNYVKYRQMCGYNALEPGRFLLVKEAGTTIVNLATQDRPGANASYVWVFESCYAAAQRLMERGIDRLAIPLIGCGIGGLVWENVEDILRAVEIMVPGFEFEVWRF